MSKLSASGGACLRCKAHAAFVWTAVLFGLSLMVACSAVARDETVGVSVTGLDHLAEHLSIQNFWVNGTLGHQAGKGGSQVCCASIPSQSRSRQTVHIRWAVTNWRDKVYSMHEREVALERCDEQYGRLWVHFLATGEVRAISCDIGPGFWEPNAEYPGPQPLFSVLPNKKPWQDYSRKPGDPGFTEIKNAMEDRKK